MKRLTLVATVIAGLLSMPALAADHDQHRDAKHHEQDQKRAAAMQQNMEEMQALMSRIKQEQDPAKRQELMQDHMKAMQENKP